MSLARAVGLVGNRASLDVGWVESSRPTTEPCPLVGLEDSTYPTTHYKPEAQAKESGVPPRSCVGLVGNRASLDVGWVESSRPTTEPCPLVGLEDSTHPTTHFKPEAQAKESGVPPHSCVGLVGEGASLASARCFVAVVVLGPVALHLAASLVLGVTLRDIWGAPLWTFVGLLALLFVETDTTERAWRRMGLAWASVTVVSLALVLAGNLVGGWRGKPSRIHYPGAELADILTERWRQRFRARCRSWRATGG